MNSWRAVGLLAGAAGLGVGELVASLVRRDAGPLFAVGGATVDLTPRLVKDLAIQVFGPADKLVLLGGMVLVITVAAMWIGQLAEQRLPIALVVVAVLGAIGLLASVTRPNAEVLAALPSVFGTLTSGVVLVGLTHLLSRQQDETERAVVPEATTANAVTRIRMGQDRRRLLIAGGLITTGAIGTAALGRWLTIERHGAGRSRAAVRIPAPASAASRTPREFVLETGELSRFHTPNEEFYRVDTALTLPQLPAEEWRLRIHGMVNRPLTIDYQQLLAQPLVERDITLACVSNVVGGPYVGNARWIGVPLKDLLEQVGVASEANQAVSRSHDGMTIGTPTSALIDGRDAILAVAMNGEPLPIEHGFPVRMVVPGLYGYVSACKWIVDLELTTFEDYDAYWVKQGWSKRAEVKTASRIDTPRDGASRRPGTIAIAGVAWAQHRGVSKVEVQIDEGEWLPAQLAETTSIDTWRQWVYRWRSEPGEHRLRARATDGEGNLQSNSQRDPFPNGATGWHEVMVTVTE